MKGEIREIVRLAKDAGLQVERTKRRHFVFRDGRGRWVATTSGTPSDHRAWKNLKASLRRAGVPIPHKGGRTNERGNQR